MRARATVLLLVLAAVLLPSATAEAAPGGCSAARKGGTAARLQTSPSLPGFRFHWHGRDWVTGQDGSVLLTRDCDPTGLRPVTNELPFGSGTARFERWFGSPEAGGAHALVAAFSTSTRVRLTFSKPDGTPVARSQLGAVRLKASTGLEVVLPAAGDSVVVPATRTVVQVDGIVRKDVTYAVQAVEVRGNNVVNRAQVRFAPRTRPLVDVPLLFFDIQVRARDALFGFSVGGTLHLEHPNGTADAVRLSDGRATLSGLPRGQYRTTVAGPGLRITQPVSLSRSQEIELKVFTWWDVTALGLAALVVALGLLIIGHRAHRRRLAAHHPRHVRTAPKASAPAVRRLPAPPLRSYPPVVLRYPPTPLRPAPVSVDLRDPRPAPDCGGAPPTVVDLTRDEGRQAVLR